MKLLKTASLAAGIVLTIWIGSTSIQTFYPSLVKAETHTTVPKAITTVQTEPSPKHTKQDRTEKEPEMKNIEKKEPQVPKNQTEKVNSQINSRPYKAQLYTTTNLNVRSGPSIEAPIWGVVKQDSKISTEAKLSNGWYQIRYNGKTGYVSGQFLGQQKVSKVFKLNVPVVLQNPELPTGCEVTSLTMALNYKGVKVDKITLANKMPYTTTFDPNQGFVGSPFKTSGETINPVKLQVLAKAYRSKSADMTGASITKIENEVRAGNPVLVWYTIGYVVPTDQYLSQNGHKYWFPQPLHCIVVTGVSSTNFYINDPLNGKKNYPIEKDRFNKIYTKMGKRALVVR